MATSASPSPSRPLTRALAHNTLRQLESELSPAVKKLADQLFALLDEQGFASVKTVHDGLFPLAETASAAAQLSTLGKKIEDAAKTKRMTLKLSFKGAKNAGVAQRQVYFAAPRAKPVADTEGLNAIAPAQRIEGQLTVPLDAPRIMLLTFNQNEFTAVRKQFWQGDSEPPTLGTGAELVDDLGDLNGWQVLHGHSRQGNLESQRSADAFRRAHAPHAIIAAGIAFGLEEGRQHISDVLVSKFIVDYETVKITADGVNFRGARPNASRSLVHSLEQLNTRQKTQLVPGWPRLHFGGILTGEKLVDDLVFRDTLVASAHQGDLIGGEMEAAGLFTALEDTGTAWVVVKSICDFGDGNKGVDKEKRQKLAAANSAMVVHALLSSPHLAHPAPLNGTDSVNTTQPAKPTTQQQKASFKFKDIALHKDDISAGMYIQGGFANSVTLDNIRSGDKSDEGAKNESPKVVAFDHLLQWLADPTAPPLYALLGEYGMGKTTHCQALTRHLEEQHGKGLDQALPTPLYFDLRKVERIAASGNNANGQATPGHVATLEETIQDCLRNGYLQTSGQALTYQDVLDVIDQGALVIFDGLDEVLSRIGDAQGMRFTANLLKVLPEAKQRQQSMGRKPDDLRLPKVLMSCRTQFFRNLGEQNSHLTGEHRGAQSADKYRASILQPFTDAQIRSYLQAALPGQNVEDVMTQIATVHNLRELAGRPFTLKLVAQFVPRIQSWIKQGRTITGATLYREVAREWLLRDKEKQSFQPQDKERLAADLAAHLWRGGQRGLRATELEAWLDAWLGQLPAHASVLRLPRDLLHQDLRNATFLKRTDAEKPENSRFEFAHTSLQEFFLADYLFGALQAGTQVSQRPHWCMLKPSDETLDFLGQILAENGAQSAELQVLSGWRKPYLPQASELQLAYALRAHQRGWPVPITVGSDLRGANLSEWHFGTLAEPGVYATDAARSPAPLLDLGHSNFAGAKLRETRFWRVRLDDANFTDAALTQAEVLQCSMARTQWHGADAAGAVCRPAPAGDIATALAAPPPTHALPAALALHLATGHADSVASCAFSPDGARALSGSGDCTMKLWDVATGECLRSFTGHADTVASCAFSPNGAQALSGSGDGTLKLWDVATGECLRSFTGHAGRVWSCAFSPEGARALSGSSDRSLKLWDVATGECLRSFTGHADWVRSCAFSPDGARALSGSSDDSLKLWDVATGECLRSFTSHASSVMSCAFSPEGAQALSGSGDSSLKLWDVATGECLRSFTGHAGRVASCAFSPNGAQALSGSEDRSLKLWDVATGECLRSFAGHAGSVMSCAFSPDGARALSGSSDDSLKLWDVATGECLRSFAGHAGRVWSCAFSANGAKALSGADDRSLKLWDVATGECLRSFAGHAGSVWSCAFSPNGARALSGSSDDSLKLWDVATGECLRSFAGHAGSVMSCAFSPNGAQALSGSLDNSLKLWDVAMGECLRSFTGHGSAVWSCAFSPDGAQALSGADDNSLKLWDVATGECLRSFTGHGGAVRSCAFSPNGAQALSGAEDNSLKLWDVAMGECLRSFTGPGRAVISCAFSPNGAQALSASLDNSLKLWDVATGECLRSFTGHAGAVMSCAFSPNGAQALSGSLDSSLKLWDVATGECLQTQLDVTQGSAAWAGDGEKLLHASGRAWRYLRWRGVDAEGAARLYPLESRPEGVVRPWAHG